MGVKGAAGAARLAGRDPREQHGVPPAHSRAGSSQLRSRRGSGRLQQEGPPRGQKWARLCLLRLRMRFPKARTEMGPGEGAEGSARIPEVTAHPSLTSSDPKSAKPNLIYLLKAEFHQILLWHQLDTAFKILFPLKKHQSAFLLKSAPPISSPEVKQLCQGTHRAMWQIVWKLGGKSKLETKFFNQTT